MKIVQVVTQMEAGGAQRVALWLADGLGRKGYEVEIWYLYKKRPLYDSTVKAVVFANKKPRSVLNYAAIMFKMALAIKKSRPNIIISHTHYANILCHLFSWCFRIPKRIAVQHNSIHTYPFSARIVDPLLGAIGIYTNIVAVSENVAQSLQDTFKKYRKRLIVIHNGIPEASGTKSADAQVQRRKWRIPDKAFVILNIGRLSKQKNQIFLIRLLLHFPEAFLVIVGEGELRNELELEASKLGVSARVLFTGEVPYSQVPIFHRLADVFVFPSLYESFGLALVEAMRCELPVVVNDMPSAHEIVGSSGYIIPLNLHDWASTLRMLVNNPILRNEFGKRAKEQSERYSVVSMVIEYEKLFY